MNNVKKYENGTFLTVTQGERKSEQGTVFSRIRNTIRQGTNVDIFYEYRVQLENGDLVVLHEDDVKEVTKNNSTGMTLFEQKSNDTGSHGENIVAPRPHYQRRAVDNAVDNPAYMEEVKKLVSMPLSSIKWQIEEVFDRFIEEGTGIPKELMEMIVLNNPDPKYFIEKYAKYIDDVFTENAHTIELKGIVKYLVETKASGKPLDRTKILDESMQFMYRDKPDEFIYEQFAKYDRRYRTYLERTGQLGQYLTESPKPHEPNKIKQFGRSIHITDDNVEVSNTAKPGTKDAEHPHDTYKIKKDTYLSNIEPITGDGSKKGSIRFPDDILKATGGKSIDKKFRNAKTSSEEKYRADARLVDPDGKEHRANIHLVHGKGQAGKDGKKTDDILRDRKVDHWKKSKKIKEGVMFYMLDDQQIEFLIQEFTRAKKDNPELEWPDYSKEYFVEMTESSPESIFVLASHIWDYEDDLTWTHPDECDHDRRETAYDIMEAVRYRLPEGFFKMEGDEE